MSNHNLLPSDDANTDFTGAHNPDTRLSVLFFRKAIQNNFQSEAQGRPIFDEADFVRINIPGDQLLTVETFVREDHKKKYPLQWAHYQNKQDGDQRLVGKTPINQWPRLSVAQVAELQHMKFLSVEDIANASDGMLQNIGMVGGMSPYAFREAAQRFLKLAADESVVQQADQRLAAVQSDNAALREQMAEMAARMDTLAAAQAPAAAPSFDQVAAANAADPVAPKPETLTKREKAK
jgi:hypothetical protein